jgi:hypothetical protein
LTSMTCPTSARSPAASSTQSWCFYSFLSNSLKYNPHLSEAVLTVVLLVAKGSIILQPQQR